MTLTCLEIALKKKKKLCFCSLNITQFRVLNYLCASYIRKPIKITTKHKMCVYFARHYLFFLGYFVSFSRVSTSAYVIFFFSKCPFPELNGPTCYCARSIIFKNNDFSTENLNEKKKKQFFHTRTGPVPGTDVGLIC